MSHLHASSKLFLDSLSGLTEAQWKFKPAPDRWSVAEVAEHIAVSEDSLMTLITKRIMTSPPAPEKKEAAKAKDPQVYQVVTDRSSRAQAPEFLRPSNRWPDRDSLIEHFKQSRARTIKYVETTQEDLRAHFAPHPALQELDAYQWLLLIAAHTERHTAQINEVKADGAFPK